MIAVFTQIILLVKNNFVNQTEEFLTSEMKIYRKQIQGIT